MAILTPKHLNCESMNGTRGADIGVTMIGGVDTVNVVIDFAMNSWFMHCKYRYSESYFDYLSPELRSLAKEPFPDDSLFARSRFKDQPWREYYRSTASGKR